MNECPKCGGTLVPFDKYEEPLLVCENQYKRDPTDDAKPLCDYQVTVREHQEA